MIKTISANQDTFKTVHFSNGFNVVMADRTKESTKKDSRNGLGKSTLIEIIHFCLGANVKKNNGLCVNELSGWEFSLELLLHGKRLEIKRAVDTPKTITLDGECSSLASFVHIENGQAKCKVDGLLLGLGYMLFGLSIDGEEYKYKPTFRSLISYFIRKGKDAYSIPFEHHRKQKEWDKQINNAFLLGLNWENAAEFQLLKDRKKGLDDFKKAANAGILDEFIGSLGDLEANKIRLKKQSEQEESDLRSFKVHPEYENIQIEANRLTAEIHEALNQNTVDKGLLELYERSLENEKPPGTDSLEQIYKEAGILLPEIALRRIDEVKNFHITILSNRKSFLSQEIEQLKHSIKNRDEFIKNKTEERSKLMEILQTHGALEEYTLLQQRHMGTVQKLNSVANKIENMRNLQNSLSDLKIEKEMTQQRSRRDYDERQNIRERAITFFNSYSEKLYNAPGKLIINLEDTGFIFDVEIERSGSVGIDNMKVFCYDLMLSRLWAEKNPSPQLLLHDSTIFDGVDERQRALALETAAEESEKYNFQYICTLNSDNVPWSEFSERFDLNEYVKLKLTDEDEEGCLLGIRF